MSMYRSTRFLNNLDPMNMKISLSVLIAAAVFTAVGRTHRVDARYLPERLDDFCWENPYCGMRAYGPRLAEPPPVGQGLNTSGIDVFNKGVPDLLMADKIIASMTNNISYHTPDGRCFDSYTVGPGRGCGGITRIGPDGVWRPDGNWKSQRVIEKSSDRAVFELVYETYVLRGTVTADTPFVRFEATSTVAAEKGALWGPGLDVAPARGHEGAREIDAAAGYAALFETKKPTGSMTAIVLDPSCRPVTVAYDKTGSVSLLAAADRKLVFYAGAAWAGAGVFPTPKKWFSHVKKFAQEINRNQKHLKP